MALLSLTHRGVAKGGARGGGRPPPNHLTIHFFKHSKLNRKLMGEGCEVKRDDTTTKLWIHIYIKPDTAFQRIFNFSLVLSTPPPKKNQGSGYAPAYAYLYLENISTLKKAVKVCSFSYLFQKYWFLRLSFVQSKSNVIFISIYTYFPVIIRENMYLIKSLCVDRCLNQRGNRY